MLHARLSEMAVVEMSEIPTADSSKEGSQRFESNYPAYQQDNDLAREKTHDVSKKRSRRRERNSGGWHSFF